MIAVRSLNTSVRAVNSSKTQGCFAYTGRAQRVQTFDSVLSAKALVNGVASKTITNTQTSMTEVGLC